MTTAPNTVITSQGTKLGIGATPTWVANLTSIDGLDVKVNTIDTTTLDNTNGYKTFVSGFKEVSDVSISGFLDTSNDQQFWTAINSEGTQAPQQFTIQFPAVGGQVTGTAWTFTGLVNGFKTKAGIDSIVSFDATLKVIGAPTLTFGE
jgi:predicted secreted protein